MPTTQEQQDILDALADAAVELQVLMPDEATVVRSALVPDGMGGQLAIETTVATVPCRVKALTGYQAVNALKISANVSYAVTVPVGTDVLTGDAVVTRGQRFEVQWVPDSTYAAQLRLLCSVGS